MAPYYPVTICRSDGQQETVIKNGTLERNEPEPKQLNDTPNAKGDVDCYRKIEGEDQKAIDWRRKLGGMLMHTLGGKAHADRNYILKELPEGYALWEHIKYNVNKVQDGQKAEKKHAGGEFERQDAYLYGHPQGRKKRFRSPAEFFPHLLWLASDKEDDPINCSCKICSPEEKGDVAEEPVREQPVKVEAPIKKEMKPIPLPAAAKNAPPKPTNAPQPALPAVARSVEQPPKTITTPQPALPAGIRSLEQRADGEPNGKFIYRPGELVWFNNNGLNWRLGVISKRQLLGGKPRYLIQPLSNPLQHQPYQIKDQDSLRPWLAWSVPITTLPSITNLQYEQVPWERVVNGDFDAGQARDYVVDGSILSAKVIDASYSLFDRNETTSPGPGEAHYNGMFLGAEKIWVGEPVRLRNPANSTNEDVMVLIVQKLIERTAPPAASVVTFVGDVYKFVEMPMPYKSRSEWPTPNLPPRMVVDLRFRNEVADLAKKGVWYEWRLMEPGAKRGLSDIKGRWYETRTLLPVLRGPPQYQDDIAKGVTTDAGAWMNGRRDKNNNPEQRKKNRRDTLGRAVPADFKVSRGLDGLPADNAFPDQQSQPAIQPDLNDIDQFMDLDQVGF